MTSSTSPIRKDQPSQGFWPLFAPYIIPPLAAAAAIIPAYSDLTTKNSLQTQQTVAHASIFKLLQGGLKVAPTMGLTIALQVQLNKRIAQHMGIESDNPSPHILLTNAAIIGAVSSPLIAAFNRQTNLNITENFIASFRALTLKEAGAITVQETAFVGGLSLIAPLTDAMQHILGEHILVKAGSAFMGGVAGALAGHIANTALTRWQSELAVDSLHRLNFHQLHLGWFYRARALGVFAMGYTLLEELLSSTVKNTKKQNQ